MRILSRSVAGNTGEKKYISSKKGKKGKTEK